MKSSSDKWVIDKWWRSEEQQEARSRPLMHGFELLWLAAAGGSDGLQASFLWLLELFFFDDNYRRGLHPIWSGMSKPSTCPPAQRALQRHTQTLNVGRRCWWKQQAWQDYENKTNASSFYYIQMNTVCRSHCVLCALVFNRTCVFSFLLKESL